MAAIFCGRGRSGIREDEKRNEEGEKGCNYEGQEVDDFVGVGFEYGVEDMVDSDSGYSAKGVRDQIGDVGCTDCKEVLQRFQCQACKENGEKLTVAGEVWFQCTCEDTEGDKYDCIVYYFCEIDSVVDNG